jgi:hypothetical protein
MNVEISGKRDGVEPANFEEITRVACGSNH